MKRPAIVLVSEVVLFVVALSITCYIASVWAIVHIVM